MATYVPGTLETDQKKLVMSLQQMGPKIDTNTTNIATNTTNIATNTTNIATNTTNIATHTSQITALQTPGAGLATSGSPVSLAVSLSKFTASLGADVNLNNIANYFDGPSIAQGTTGTWFVSGSVTVTDTAAANIQAKLWDGTTVIASGFVNVAAGGKAVISLSGYIASPAANLRISAKDLTNTTGKIIFNLSGESKDSTISAFRIA